MRTSTLANGLRVVVVRDPAAAEVQVTMRYGVGAVDDGANPGLAHLVEHLMFQQDKAGQSLFTIARPSSMRQRRSTLSGRLRGFSRTTNHKLVTLRANGRA